MTQLLLLLTLSQPAMAGSEPAFWSLDGPPAAYQLQAKPLLAAAFVAPHGPDNSSGADVPAGGFKYKKKKKPVLSYVGGSLSLVGLLYLAGSRTASFEAADAPTEAERQAFETEQANKKVIGLSVLGTAGACFVLDIFI